jgi:hypothetical protein
MVTVNCIFDGFSSKHKRCVVENQTILSKSSLPILDSSYSFLYTEIDHLKFSNCKILLYPEDMNESFCNIWTLEIIDCQLSSFERRHMSHLLRLICVAVVNCGLKKINDDLFCDQQNLSEISLYGNQLEEIGPKIFDDLPNLKTVDLRENTNINMWHDFEDPTSVTLDEIKNEIKEKCKPKNGPRKAAGTPNVMVKQCDGDQVMLADLKKILADDTFKDFTINVGGTSFKVHKLLFAARSQILREMFKNNPEAVELNLRDIPESTFKSVHDFIYNNQLSPDANCLEVFSAASMLKIDDLTMTAAGKLLSKIDESNAFEVLVLSNKFEHEQLRQKAFEIIRTKIFPDRKFDDELMRQPEKLKKLIESKRRLDMDFEEMLKLGEASGSGK